ncbi:MAG: transposase [Acidobacteriota bacterium]|nr:MAG: transposase [Acidobacteriota bacterium]
MYYYRNLTEEEKLEIVESRRARRLNWHSPTHLALSPSYRYLVTAACFEHRPIIGTKLSRMSYVEEGLLSICEELQCHPYAWCVLPNHYHILVNSVDIRSFCRALGKFHGRSSFDWNREDDLRGRQVWYRCFDRAMKSDRHFWASMNYVHNNPVHHGYVDRWTDWPWSSAEKYLEAVGRDRASEIWREYPLLDYGKKWDI